MRKLLGLTRYLMLATKGRSFTSMVERCEMTQNVNSFVSGTDHEIVHRLVSIFTKQPLSSSSSHDQLQELNSYGRKLSPKIVENVLGSLKSFRVAQVFFKWASNQVGCKHNCYAYTALATHLSRARQNDQLKKLGLEMVNSGCKLTPGSLGFFIRCFGSLGMVEEADEWFAMVRETGLCVPNSYSYNCLLEAMSRDPKFIELLELRFKEMCDIGCVPNAYTLTPLLQAYCGAGKFEKAMNVFSGMEDRGMVDAHVYSILLLSFLKCGMADKVVELLERMEESDIQMNEKTFCVLIHGLVKECRVDEALLLFRKMLRCGNSPDLPLYDVLIEGLCKIKRVDIALCLYMKMKQSGISPDVKIHTNLASSISDGEQLSSLVDDIEESNDANDMITIFNAILNSFVDKGSIMKAYNLLLTMMGDQPKGVALDEEVELLSGKHTVRPNLASFNIVIHGLCKTREVDMALFLFESMDKYGCQKDTFLYNNLIEGLCSSDRLDESCNLLKKMKEDGFVPTDFTYNSLYGCLCQRGDATGALDMIKVMRLYGHVPWTKHTMLLVKELCKYRKVAEACSFLESIFQEGFPPDVIVYSVAIDGFVKIQDMDKALELFHSICARGLSPDIVFYNVLINGLCKAKRISEAENILNEISQKGLTPSTVTYNSLIDGWCKNDEIDEAVLCISRMVEKEREPNVVTYTTVVDGLCNAGRPVDALQLWDDMERKGCLPNRVSYMALINGLCKCGRPNEAYGFFQEMEKKNMHPDCFVYVALISAFISDLDLMTALEILKKLIEARKFPDQYDRNYLPLRDSIAALHKDSSTCLSIEKLVADGCMPAILSTADDP
uniref:Pentatricopeptide repeat-containing protein n=1 Tax=Kalanchoe fedtschenkoi TaxID=63787 RepID=A0A7N0TMX2_KALFE